MMTGWWWSRESRRRLYCAKAKRARPRRRRRARLEAGELGLDIYGMREKLAQKGLVYRPAEVEG
jgi:4-hydroxy-4-methyl-2-oxoglutarate aldolase